MTDGKQRVSDLVRFEVDVDSYPGAPMVVLVIDGDINDLIKLSESKGAAVSKLPMEQRVMLAHIFGIRVDHHVS